MNYEIEKILGIADDFLEVLSVICYEGDFLKYLDEKISALGYNTILTQGYLAVSPDIKEGCKEPRYLFSAHIDRHGLIRNDAGDLEYAAYYFKKRFNLEFKRDYYEFYLSCAQRHTKDVAISYSKERSEIIRNDLDSKKKLVTFNLREDIKGDVFGFGSKIQVKEDLFFGQIDNVISVAVLFYLLENSNFCEEVIFTTQEEIGLSYLNVLDYLRDDGRGLDIITLDTSPYENFKGKKNGFVTLRRGDENGSFNLELVGKIEDMLEEMEVPADFKSSDNGMTELGRISSESSGRLNGASIQLPTMNYHTTYETSKLLSLENYLKIIREFIE